MRKYDYDTIIIGLLAITAISIAIGLIFLLIKQL